MPKPIAPLALEPLRAALAGSRFADVRYVAKTASTNVDAQALLGVADARGSTIVAEFQTAGAGRKGRRWFATPGSALLFTTILPEPIDATALWAVPFWVALGVAQGVQHACGIALDLVWPNDLYVHGGKLGGILCVARVTGDVAWVGCGVGLNVHRPLADPDLAAMIPPPAFLEDRTDAVAREDVLAAILRSFEASIGELDAPTAIATRWADRARLAGTRYRYRRDSDGVEREGIAQRIGPYGTLVVRDADGEQHIDMADVRVIARPASPAQEQTRFDEAAAETVEEHRVAAFDATVGDRRGDR